MISIALMRMATRIRMLGALLAKTGLTEEHWREEFQIDTLLRDVFTYARDGSSAIRKKRRPLLNWPDTSLWATPMAHALHPLPVHHPSLSTSKKELRRCLTSGNEFSAPIFQPSGFSSFRA